MTIDLSLMSKEELLALQKDISKALVNFDKRQKQAALAAAQQAARDHGFSLDEILGQKTPAKAAPAKYRNPENSAQTWSGRGRQPEWFKAAIAAGTTADAMEI